MLEILLVEDNRAETQIVRLAMTEAGIAFNLHAVSSATAAFDYLGQRGLYTEVRRPHLIIIDLNLPGVNGHDLLLRLKTDSPYRAIPVIVLSSSQNRADVLASLELQASGYFVKPSDVNVLVEQMKVMARYWRDCLQIIEETEGESV